MIAEIGAFAASLALALSLAQGVMGLMASRRDSRAEATAAIAQAAAALCAFAFACLIALFVQSDFSVAVVSANSHIDKPLIYKIAGAWGNHEGSMLLWCTVSALFGAILASTRGRQSLALWSRAVGVQGLVTAGALIYTLFLSPPFARLDPAPMIGSGLNPLLQDPALVAHPPLLYLGYVGLSVPFSLAIAALISGRADQAWARALRPWTLAAWTFLTTGIAVGSYWAYYELGWGGWWFWDPVENASFMPWLVAAALVHSAIVTERRGSLASWTILLAIMGFGLAILGTFLVRSGVLTSVHAFAVDPTRGIAMLVLLFIALGIGFGMYAWRAPKLRQPSGFAAVSRESMLVWNNFGLAVAAGVVLIGTLYPLIVEAAGGGLISVGPPFFNATVAPLIGVLFLLLPLGPMLTWRVGDMRAALMKLAPAAILAAVTLIAALALSNWRAAPAIGLALGVWLVAGGLIYLWTRLQRGEGHVSAKLALLPLAVWSMSLAHIGAGVLTIGAIAETSFRSERAVALRPGEGVAFAGGRVTLLEVGQIEGPNYSANRASFRVDRRGASQLLSAERRFFPTSPMPTTEVGILGRIDGDLYVALGEAVRDTPGAWSVRLYHNPLVYLIFLGGIMMALGGVLSLIALARRRKVGP
ncbi:MAG TPA: heme lyase CcmF/NrfE family subunit [Vitreimonas sp.]|uniref:heme lyase CcmF/NrfE family subunit n=1 Tax=Vitreimonas sp. TaxID=3069702 RepID=UPI002D44A9C0|nr:heme lyase CcmF/NrfE family subunit [Vitreimonas sp.]HYD89195.1 heme lyase CcmF/NrfE family subunit [Vitreimonas sp.]